MNWLYADHQDTPDNQGEAEVREGRRKAPLPAYEGERT